MPINVQNGLHIFKQKQKRANIVVMTNQGRKQHSESILRLGNNVCTECSSSQLQLSVKRSQIHENK